MKLYYPHAYLKPAEHLRAYYPRASTTDTYTTTTRQHTNLMQKQYLVYFDNILHGISFVIVKLLVPTFSKSIRSRTNTHTLSPMVAEWSIVHRVHQCTMHHTRMLSNSKYNFIEAIQQLAIRNTIITIYFIANRGFPLACTTRHSLTLSHTHIIVSESIHIPKAISSSFYDFQTQIDVCIRRTIKVKWENGFDATVDTPPSLLSTTICVSIMICVCALSACVWLCNLLYSSSSNNSTNVYTFNLGVVGVVPENGIIVGDYLMAPTTSASS